MVKWNYRDFRKRNRIEAARELERRKKDENYVLKVTRVEVAVKYNISVRTLERGMDELKENYDKPK